MYLLYSFVLSLAFVALLPYFIFKAIRTHKYSSSFGQRLGRLPESATSTTPTIWVHAVSVGEFLAARPLIESLRLEFPDWRVVVSTTTLTGQQLAQDQTGKLIDAAFYFPFDWMFSARRALNQIRPRLVVLIETEVWPNFLRECRKRGIPTALANGRISERSFKGYRRARMFIRGVLRDISLLVMQSDADAERVRALGARDQSVRVCGNLKYDISSPDLSAAIEALLTPSKNGVGSDLIVAGSTAPGEEELILSAFGDVRRHPGLESTRLVIAPRHPERFAEVADLIARFAARSGLTFARRSECVTVPATEAVPAFGPADIILLDSIGELGGVYSKASVAFVGGSLARKGGHNIVEPASFAKPIIVGPHTDNFRQIVADFRDANAVVQLPEISQPEEVAAELSRQIVWLLSDRDAASAMGERAGALLRRSRGATECTAAAIRTIVSAKQ